MANTDSENIKNKQQRFREFLKLFRARVVGQGKDCCRRKILLPKRGRLGRRGLGGGMPSRPSEVRKAPPPARSEQNPAKKFSFPFRRKNPARANQEKRRKLFCWVASGSELRRAGFLSSVQSRFVQSSEYPIAHIWRGHEEVWDTSVGESNPRLVNPESKLVDPGRIELPPVQCECTVIPLYYGPIYRPTSLRTGRVRMFPICSRAKRLTTNRNPPKVLRRRTA